MRTIAVVLHFGDPAATARCVASLAGQCEHLVVDNDAENRGFAGGMNLGAALAFAQGADAVLLVNNDAVLSPGCVAALAAAGADLAAPTIVHGLPPADGPLWYAGGRLSRWTGETRHFTASRLDGEEGRPGVGAACPVSFVSGCVLWVRREAWSPLDERFFLYHEDADLCWRAADAGLAIKWVPAARAWHEGGAATGSQARKAPALDYYDTRNGLLLLRTHLRGPRLALAVAWWAGVRVPRKAARLLLRGPRRAGLRAVLAGVRDGLAGRTGPWLAACALLIAGCAAPAGAVAVLDVPVPILCLDRWEQTNDTLTLVAIPRFDAVRDTPAGRPNVVLEARLAGTTILLSGRTQVQEGFAAIATRRATMPAVGEGTWTVVDAADGRELGRFTPAGRPQALFWSWEGPLCPPAPVDP